MKKLNYSDNMVKIVSKFFSKICAKILCKLWCEGTFVYIECAKEHRQVLTAINSATSVCGNQTLPISAMCLLSAVIISDYIADSIPVTYTSLYL